MQLNDFSLSSINWNGIATGLTQGLLARYQTLQQMKLVQAQQQQQQQMLALQNAQPGFTVGASRVSPLMVGAGVAGLALLAVLLSRR